MIKFSIVIPVYNEADNLYELINEINKSLIQYKEYEIIIVDDGSDDNTDKIIQDIKDNYPIRSFKHHKNLGQSRSILLGVNHASYDTIVTMDGDGQNNPYDIPNLLKVYCSSNKFSLVGGIRKKRMDSLIKILSSKVANKVRSLILSDNCSDTGCSLKVFNKGIFLRFPYFDSIHRFLPALFTGFGFKTNFILVEHRPRLKGKSKYGTFDRLFKGIVDLIKVKIMISRYKK